MPFVMNIHIEVPATTWSISIYVNIQINNL